MLRRLAIAPALCALVLPASAGAQATAIGSTGGPSMVGADRGWRVWSERPRGAVDWRIVVRAPLAGVISRPAVPTRSIPFDVDVGLDEQGEVVATYSRCRREPVAFGGANPYAAGGLPQYTTGRDCTIWILDLTTGKERPVARRKGDLSEVLPSIAGRRLAFIAVRAGRRNAGRATLSVRDLQDGDIRRLYTARRKRGGATNAAGPTAVDTDGRTVAVAWRTPQRRGFRDRILVQRLSARRPTVAASARDPAGAGFAALLAPTVDGSAVSWLETTGRGFCERRFTGRGQSPGYGIERDSTASPVSAALDGDTLVIGEVQANDRAPTARSSDGGQVVERERGAYAERPSGSVRCG